MGECKHEQWVWDVGDYQLCADCGRPKELIADDLKEENADLRRQLQEAQGEVERLQRGCEINEREIHVQAEARKAAEARLAAVREAAIERIELLEKDLRRVLVVSVSTEPDKISVIQKIANEHLVDLTTKRAITTATPTACPECESLRGQVAEYQASCDKRCWQGWYCNNRPACDTVAALGSKTEEG